MADTMTASPAAIGHPTLSPSAGFDSPLIPDSWIPATNPTDHPMRGGATKTNAMGEIACAFDEIFGIQGPAAQARASRRNRGDSNADRSMDSEEEEEEQQRQMQYHHPEKRPIVTPQSKKSQSWLPEDMEDDLNKTFDDCYNRTKRRKTEAQAYPGQVNSRSPQEGEELDCEPQELDQEEVEGRPYNIEEDNDPMEPRSTDVHVHVHAHNHPSFVDPAVARMPPYARHPFGMAAPRMFPMPNRGGPYFTVAPPSPFVQHHPMNPFGSRPPMVLSSPVAGNSFRAPAPYRRYSDMSSISSPAPSNPRVRRFSAFTNCLVETPSSQHYHPQSEFSPMTPAVMHPSLVESARSPQEEDPQVETAPSSRATSPEEVSSPHAAVPDQEDLLKWDTPHFDERPHVPLGLDEDQNFLTDFQAYARKEFLEVFQATHQDVKFRNTSRKVVFEQLGLRCRFCAHVHPGQRARRSSAYPSSIPQIYQSFNMMIRDHFPKCAHVPAELQAKFSQLKGRNSQGAADSKQYWTYAAEKIGMVDSPAGILWNDETKEAAEQRRPFGNNSVPEEEQPPVLLVTPEDQNSTSDLTHLLLSQVQRIHLLECEQMSTRKSLKVGLPGYGCRYCCEVGRLGFSRIFPTKRKGLPEKTSDIYEHLRRCTLCPAEVKEQVEKLHKEKAEPTAQQRKVLPREEKAFYDRVWERLQG